ncbi:MAG: 50S ribosomal protein L11 methyltransferase [Thiogranum sp.]
MAWRQLVIEAGDLDVEALSAFFETQGALSVTLVDAGDQPLFEPDPGTTPLWSSTRLTALFDDDVDLAPVREAFGRSFGEASQRLVEQGLADQDWERSWLDRFQPMRFGEHLWVCPAGQRPPRAAGQVLVDLDPGLAFGTGTHPTTALCLEWLDRHPPVDCRVLDFGCGSGILAIAALKLGAAAVWAADIDPQALWATRENARRNRVAERLNTGLPADVKGQRFAVLLANILANPLIELAPRLAEVLEPGGRLVLSGILSEQADAVRRAYAPWVSFAPLAVQQDWVRLEGIKSASLAE